MTAKKEIINRVAQSSLITFDLETHYHLGERVALDLKDWLYEGIILKEKDFREAVKAHDWSGYQDKNVAVFCSADAIIPTWAYMLVAVHLEPYAHFFVTGSPEVLEQALFQQALARVDITKYEGARVVVKGCGNVPVPPYAYTEITRILRPVAASIMYGEPCSTVPLYKRPKK